MDLAIVGGGLSGPLAAVFLARRGHQVTLYERRADPRTAERVAGRSINLALSARGIDALQRVGLVDDVMAHALPMHGRTLHDRNGTTAYQSYSADGSKAINSVSRSALNDVLLSAAESTPGVSIRFEHRVTEADDTGVLKIETPGGATTKQHDVVIGMDGAYSAIRERIVRSSRMLYDH